MPTNTVARLTNASAASTRPSTPPCTTAPTCGAPGMSTRWVTTRSQQLLGRCQQLGAVVVLVGEVLPDRPGERLPLDERRVVEVGHLGPGLLVDGGDGVVVGLRAFDGERLELGARRHDRVLLRLRQLVEDHL